MGNGDLREKLFEVQEMTPGLREAYRKELEATWSYAHTGKTRAMAILLLVICLAVVVGEVRAMIVYPKGMVFYVGAMTMLVACGVTGVWIVRDLLRGKSQRKGTGKVAMLFYTAASVLTVVTLMHGLGKPGDPASMFNAFYVFVFMVVCLGWSLACRIEEAELAGKEQMLRVECRVAELVERMGK
jgi:hypothetical protein